MNNNIAHNPFPGFPPELWPEALQNFDPFYRELLIDGWNAKRELAALKRWLQEHRSLASFHMDEAIAREREQVLANWPGIGR